MFGLTFEKLLLIGVLAVILVGPERLPRYAADLARFVKWLRSFADGARSRMREEMGPEFDEVDWKKLDPRQYDPRRIIREALTDDEPPPRQVVRPARRPPAPERTHSAAAGPPSDPPSSAVAGASVIAAARSAAARPAPGGSPVENTTDATGAADGSVAPYDAEAT